MVSPDLRHNHRCQAEIPRYPAVRIWPAISLPILADVFRLFNPLAGTVALNLILGVTFASQGAVELAFVLEMRPLGGWVSMLLSGIRSIIIAILIVASWPPVWILVLGILLGVNFLATGLSIFSLRGPSDCKIYPEGEFYWNAYYTICNEAVSRPMGPPEYGQSDHIPSLCSGYRGYLAWSRAAALQLSRRYYRRELSLDF